jgi:hypothetical protein
MVIGAVAGMLMDQPEAIELVREMADTSKCRLHSDVHGGTNRHCYTHPGLVPRMAHRMDVIFTAYLVRVEEAAEAAAAAAAEEATVEQTD